MESMPDALSIDLPVTALGPMEGWDVVNQASELSRRGEEFALATVVWRQGPSSGQQGSRAIVTADGRLIGWIGGACSEPIVIREAQQVIASREPKLLLLGTPDQFGAAVPQGMAVTPISCASEGAMEVYIEPVLPTPHLVVVGRSPMARTLVDLARALGWRCELIDAVEFSAAHVDPRTIVVVATQGHGDEEAVERAVAAFPAFVGLVASRKRGATVLGYLGERGVPANLLERVQIPVGLDLGHTTHREIAVAVLAELVKRRAAGELVPDTGEERTPPAGHEHGGNEHAGHEHGGHEHGVGRRTLTMAQPVTVVDPVCGMAVLTDGTGFPYEYEGTTYHFCCPGCRASFEKNPREFVPAAVG